MLRAVLADAKRFDLSTVETKEVLPGKRVVKAKAAGSLTVEPIAWEFDCGEDEAKAWLSASGIPFVRLEDEPDEPEFLDDFEFEVGYPGTVRRRGGAELKLTSAMLSTMVRCTNELLDSGKYRSRMRFGDKDTEFVRVQLGHDPDQSPTERMYPRQGAPALGYVKRLYLRAKDRVWAVATQVPKRFAKAVVNGEWQDRSMGIQGDWKHPETGKVYEFVMDHVAFLGDTNPALPGLAPIVGFTDEAEHCFVYFADEPSVQEPKDTPGSPAPASGKDPSTESAAAGAAQPNQEPSPEEKAAMEKTVEQLTAELAAANEGRIKDRLNRAAADRKIDPGEVDKRTKVALGMDEETRGLYLAEIDEREPKADTTKPLSQGGTPPSPAKSEKKGEARLIELAEEEMAKDPKLDFAEAWVRAGVRDKEAVEAYRSTFEKRATAAKEA